MCQHHDRLFQYPLYFVLMCQLYQRLVQYGRLRTFKCELFGIEALLGFEDVKVQSFLALSGLDVQTALEASLLFSELDLYAALEASLF